MAKILVIDDKPSMRKMLQTNLELEGYEVIVERSPIKGILWVESGVDLILSDLKMKEMTGLEFLREIRRKNMNTPFILMTAYAKIKDAVEAMKLGAADFIEKPFEIDDLLYLIQKTLKLQRFETENMVFKAFTARSNEEITIIGQSDLLRKTLSILDKVSKTDSSVLLTGKSGTGKEVLAKYIHHHSKRGEYPFVAINCAAIPSELMEAELFGYERGAFTGADSRKMGLFELANHGTIFLDEIGELPFKMQSKLLRVLQEQSFLRVGGLKSIQTDVRILSATNRDLLTLIGMGEFREDLYFRISVIPVNVPSLNERREDIPLLIEYFMKFFIQKLNIPPIGFSDDARKVLQEYNYRGNIRELKNIIERAVILADNNLITTEELGIVPAQKKGNSYLVDQDFELDFPLQKISEQVIRFAESKHILRVLQKEGWNRTHAAKRLQVSYKTLLTKIKDYQLTP